MTLIYSADSFRIRPAHCSARALKVCVGLGLGLNFIPTNQLRKLDMKPLPDSPRGD